MKTSVRVSLILITLPLVLACCTTSSERGTQSGGSPPVITHSSASKAISHGDTWRIYVEANDPDGDMRQFVCVFKQVGFGSYSPDYVVIKGPHGEKLKGYLRFFSGAGGGLKLDEWTKLSLAGRGDEMRDYKYRDWVRAGIDRGGFLTVPMDIMR